MIEITQTCDGCKKSRSIRAVSEERNLGWRPIDGKHLCAECIDKAFGKER